MTRKLFKIQILLAAKKANVSIKRNKIFKRLQLPSHSVSIEPNATYYNAQTIFSMGAYSYSRSALPVDTVVGRYCSIGSGVTALRVDHPLNGFTTSTITYCKKSHKNNLFKTIPYLPNEAPIIIGHDVWIGEGVKIKKGVTIGNGAVIGANSIVTKDIPPYSIAVGSPAKVVKYRFEQDIIDQLIDSEWWNYDLNQINIPLDSSPIDIISAVKKLKPIKYKAIKI